MAKKLYMAAVTAMLVALEGKTSYELAMLSIAAETAWNDAVSSAKKRMEERGEEIASVHVEAVKKFEASLACLMAPPRPMPILEKLIQEVQEVGEEEKKVVDAWVGAINAPPPPPNPLIESLKVMVSEEEDPSDNYPLQPLPDTEREMSADTSSADTIPTVVPRKTVRGMRLGEVRKANQLRDWGKFSAFIKEKWAASGFKQSEYAAYLSQPGTPVRQSDVSGWVCMVHRPTPKQMEVVAKEYNLRVEELFQ